PDRWHRGSSPRASIRRHPPPDGWWGASRERSFLAPGRIGNPWAWPSHNSIRSGPNGFPRFVDRGPGPPEGRSWAHPHRVRPFLWDRKTGRPPRRRRGEKTKKRERDPNFCGRPSRLTSLRGLQSFQIDGQPEQPLPDLFDGVGVGKANVPVASRPKVNAGRNPHLGLLEAVEGEVVGIFRVTSKIHKGVKGPFRIEAGLQSDF